MRAEIKELKNIIISGNFDRINTPKKTRQIPITYPKILKTQQQKKNNTKRLAKELKGKKQRTLRKVKSQFINRSTIKNT